MGRQVEYTSWGYKQLVEALQSVRHVGIYNVVQSMRQASPEDPNASADNAFAFLVAAFWQNISNIPHEDFNGLFADTFREAVGKLANCAVVNSQALKEAGEALAPFADQAVEQVTSVLPHLATAPTNAQAANNMREEAGRALDKIYDPLPDSLPGLTPPPQAGNPNAPSGVTRAGGTAQPGGVQASDAVKAFAERARQDALDGQDAAGAPGADPSQAAKPLADALGQAGQAAGQAAQGAGQAGKGMDPSQLASGLADALKPKGEGDGLGAGTDAALDVGDEAALPGSLDAAAGFAAPVGGGIGGIGGGAAESARTLSPATGHGGPTQQAQPAAQLSSLAQQSPRPPAGGGMGSMPLGGMPHGQQGSGGKERRLPDYLKDQALLSDNPADHAVDAVIGELSAQEVEQREQQSVELGEAAQAEGAKA